MNAKPLNFRTQNDIDSRYLAALERQQQGSKTRYPEDSPATILFPGTRTSQADSQDPWKAIFDKNGDQRNLQWVSPDDLSTSDHLKLQELREQNSNPPLLDSAVQEGTPADRMPLRIDPDTSRDSEQRSGGGDGGNTTGGDGGGTVTLSFQKAASEKAVESTQASEPATSSGPSLALVLSGIGFLASSTVSVLAHFTEAFDQVKEPVKFCFDSLSVILACLMAFLALGGEGKAAQKGGSLYYTEADG